MHDKIRRVFAAAFVAVVAAFGAIAVQSPAQAVWSDCAAYNNVICFHQYPDFSGQVWRQTTGQFPTGCRNLNGFDNKASTAFNLTDNYILRVYQNANCSGRYVGLLPGEVSSFGQDDTWFNNTASSAKISFVG